MSTGTFFETVAKRAARSRVCLELLQRHRSDHHLHKAAQKGVLYHRKVVDATADEVAGYVLNINEYAKLYGKEYWASVLEETIAYIRDVGRNGTWIPVIVECAGAKVGPHWRPDAVLRMPGVHAVIVNPYKKSPHPIGLCLLQSEKGVLVKCRTVVPCERTMQGKPVTLGGGPRAVQAPMYECIARQAATDWNLNGNCGLVVDPTDPEELERVRQVADGVPVLVSDCRTSERVHSALCGANRQKHMTLLHLNTLGDQFVGKRFEWKLRDHLADLNAAAVQYH